jgi:hypothetical protein
MKNEKIINAFNTVQPSDKVRNRVFEKAMQKQHKKRPVFKTAATLATAAAMICLMVFGSMYLSPQSDNVFSMKAYAMEYQADGSVDLGEIDLTNQQHIGGGYLDNGILYLNTILKCEGENIKYVEFSTDDGFFAKQKENLYIEEGKTIYDYSPKFNIGEDDTLHIVWHGSTNFEKIGNSLTLDSETINDNLIFLGTEYIGGQMPYSTITINAVVTFNDGKQQEETLVIKFAYMGITFAEEYPTMQ